MTLPDFRLDGRLAVVTGASSGLGRHFARTLAGVGAAFDAVAAWRGVPDLLVNNAGVAVARPLPEQSEADFDGMLLTNLKGAWRVAQVGARRLVAAGRPGAIVDIASITGERVAGGGAPCCASKAALLQLTREMGLELAPHGIHVNALAPGHVATELNRDFLASPAGQRLMARIPQVRFGEPADRDGGHQVGSL